MQLKANHIWQVIKNADDKQNMHCIFYMLKLLRQKKTWIVLKQRK